MLPVSTFITIVRPGENLDLGCLPFNTTHALADDAIVYGATTPSLGIRRVFCDVVAATIYLYVALTLEMILQRQISVLTWTASNPMHAYSSTRSSMGVLFNVIL